MKKTIAFFALWFATFSASMAAALPNEELQLNQSSLEKEFEQLNKIEQYVDANEGITLTEIQAKNAELLDNVTLTDSTTSFTMAGELPLLGAFWWGCCLGIVGLALVYFITDNDREQVKSALIGCVISTLLVGLGGIFNPFGWF